MHPLALIFVDELVANDFRIGSQDSVRIIDTIMGDFGLTWQSQYLDGSGYAAVFRLFQDTGEPWGSEWKTSNYVTSDQHQPDGKLNDNNEYIMVWRSFEQHSDQGGIYMNAFTYQGSPDFSDTLVHDSPTGDQSHPRVAYVDGRHVATWDSTVSGDTDVKCKIFETNFSVNKTEFTVNNYTSGTQSHPVIATLTED